jgi:topoisomerase IA-like protein
MEVATLTFDQALNLLGERAARGPAKKGRRGRAPQAGKPSGGRATKKKGAPQKTAKRNEASE